MDWIPVAERLPEIGEEVLVLWKRLNGPVDVSIAWRTMDGGSFSTPSYNCRWESRTGLRAGSETHWLPLPDLPKPVSKKDAALRAARTELIASLGATSTNKVILQIDAALEDT